MGRHRRFLALFGASCIAAVTVAAQTPRPPPEIASAPAPREPVNVSNAQLGLEVQSRLYQALDISNLSALVRYGVVTLDGRVRSEVDRQRAEQIALEVYGVDSVVNKLTVDTPVVVALANEAAVIAERESSDLARAVSERLQSDPVLGSRDIHVEADEIGNTVTLTGTVSTEDEKESAGRLAGSALTTARVRNQLEVRQRL